MASSVEWLGSFERAGIPIPTPNPLFSPLDPSLFSVQLACSALSTFSFTSCVPLRQPPPPPLPPALIDFPFNFNKKKVRGKQCLFTVWQKSLTFWSRFHFCLANASFSCMKGEFLYVRGGDRSRYAGREVQQCAIRQLTQVNFELMTLL